MAFVQPNVYVLFGSGLSVTYTTTSLGGPPQFTYHSLPLTHTFAGDEIKAEPSDALGTLVSVTLALSPDTGSTTFTLLVPHVNLLSESDSVPVVTQGITTQHRFSPVTATLHGQLDTYMVMTLTGTASFFKF
jgi:hypothetical protein